MSSLIHMAMQRLYFHFQIKYLYLKGSAVYRNKNFCPLCHVWAAFAWILTIHKFWPSVYNVCARRAAELRPVHGDLLHRGPAQDPHRRQEAPGQDQDQQREHLQVGEIITQLPMALRPFSYCRCSVCNITTTDQNGLTMHLQGKAHQAALKKGGFSRSHY